MVVGIHKANFPLFKLFILMLLVSVAAVAGTLQNNPHEHYSKLLFDDIVMGRCYEYEQNYNAEGLEKHSCTTIVRTLRTILDNHQESDEPHVLTDVFHTIFVDGVMNGSYNPYEYYHVASSSSSAASSSSSVIVTPTIWMSLYGGTDTKSQNAQRIKNMFRVDEKTDTENHYEDTHQQYYYVTPETTIGGELLEGLVFCAQNPTLTTTGAGGGPAEDTDPTSSCSIETSNAYWSYWKAVYTAFTDHVVRHALLRGDAITRMLLVVDNPLIDYDFLREAVLIHLKATTTTARSSKDYIDDYDYDDADENNGQTKKTQQNSLIQIDLWGVDCESSPLVDKIMHYFDEDHKNDNKNTDASNRDTTMHGNNYGAVSKLPKLSVVCHGPDLVELGLCYNNNKDSSPCRQYQRGKDPTNTMDESNTNNTHHDGTSSSHTTASVSASSTKSGTNPHQPGTTEHDRIIDTHNHANFSNTDRYNITTTTTYFWYHLFSSCMLVLIGYILGVFYGYGYSIRTKIVNVVYCCDKYNNKHNTGTRNRRSDFHNSRTNTIRYGSLENDSITLTDSSTDDEDNTMDTVTGGSCHNNPSVSRHPSFFVEPFWVHGSGNSNNNNNDPTNNNTSRTSTTNNSAENTNNIRNSSYQCTLSQ